MMDKSISDLSESQFEPFVSKQKPTRGKLPRSGVILKSPQATAVILSPAKRDEGSRIQDASLRSA